MSISRTPRSLLDIFLLSHPLLSVGTIMLLVVGGVFYAYPIYMTRCYEPSAGHDPFR